MIEQYYFGQGRVFSLRAGATANKWRWWGDVSKLSLTAELEKVTHKESYSGNKGTVREFPVSKTLKVAATLRQIDTQSLADSLFGAVSTVAGASVTDEVFPTGITAGDVVKLAYPGVSALVIKDSAGSPVTIAAQYYELDARFGSIEFLGLPTAPAPTEPLKASYTYAGYKQVNFLTQAQPVMALRYEGVNLAEGNAPVIVELYKMSTDPLKELALITDGTDLAGLEIEAAVLIDSSKSATGSLGQFGRFLQVTTP